MKRVELLNYLKDNNCEFYREGSRHTIYQNKKTGKVVPIPRHSEIDNLLFKKICKELDIPVKK